MLSLIHLTLGVDEPTGFKGMYESLTQAVDLEVPDSVLGLLVHSEIRKCFLGSYHFFNTFAKKSWNGLLRYDNN